MTSLASRPIGSICTYDKFKDLAFDGCTNKTISGVNTSWYVLAGIDSNGDPFKIFVPTYRHDAIRWDGTK